MDASGNCSANETTQTEPPRPSRRTPGSGRRKGTPNRVTRQIREIACRYTARAVRQAWKLATEAKNQDTQLKALELILAYGHGRPPQVQLLGGTGEDPVALKVHREMQGNPREMARRLEAMLGAAGLSDVVEQTLVGADGDADNPVLEAPTKPNGGAESPRGPENGYHES